MGAAAESKPWSKGKRMLIMGGIATIAIGAIMYWNYATFVGGLWSADPKSPDCIQSEATITEMYASSGSKKQRESYNLKYEYQVEGKTRSGHEEVTSNIYNRSNLGGKLEICYMKDHPGRSAVIGNDVAGQNYFMVILVDIGLVLVIILVIRDNRKRSKKAIAAKV